MFYSQQKKQRIREKGDIGKEEWKETLANIETLWQQ